MSVRAVTLVTTVTAVAVLMALAACGGGHKATSGFGTGVAGLVSTSISDPATCSAPFGPFSHVFVTVRDVKVHVNQNAADNDPGFVDLTPNMMPAQVDLLGTANAQCFLAQLGTNVQAAAGTYQQIRIFLLDNSQGQALSNNQCGSGNGVNCVVLTSDGSTHPLNLSSEATTGIKLPSGQISGGGLTVQSGQTVNLNLNFDACASIVFDTNGQFRLKPVVHAAAISAGANNTITGHVIDATTSGGISGGKTIVALEERDATGAHHVVMETTPDGAGNFVFCPVPPGTHTVVATALNGAGVAYAATITFSVPPGTSLGNVPLVPQPGSGSASSPATINGTVTTTGTAGAIPADVVLSAIQSPSVNLGAAGNPPAPVPVIIPLAAQGASAFTVTTQATGCAVSTTACANYGLQVPAANPNVGIFNTAGTTYSQDLGSQVTYAVNGEAFAINVAATPTCAPPVTQITTINGGGALVVTGGNPVTAASMAFSGCL